MSNIWNQSDRVILDHLKEQIGTPSDGVSQSTKTTSVVTFSDTHITDKDLILNSSGTTLVSCHGSGILMKYDSTPLYKSLTWNNTNSKLTVNDAFDISGSLSINNVVVIDASQKGTLVELKVDDLKEKTGANGIVINNHMLALNNTINIGDAGTGEYNNIYGANIYSNALRSTGSSITLTGTDILPDTTQTRDLGSVSNEFAQIWSLDGNFRNIKNQGSACKFYCPITLDQDDQHNLGGSSGIRWQICYIKIGSFNELRSNATNIDIVPSLIPTVNDAIDLATDSKRFNTTYCSNVKTNQLYGLDDAITVNQSLNPSSDDGYSLGANATNRWSKLWCRGVQCDQLLPNTTNIVCYANLITDGGSRKLGESGTSFNEVWGTTTRTNTITTQTGNLVLSDTIEIGGVTNTKDIGTSSKLVNTIYSTNLQCNNLYGIATNDIITHDIIHPTTNDTLSVGKNGYVFNGVHCTGLVCNNIYSISGDVILHNHLRPTNGTPTLGTVTNPWANATITTLANTTLNTTTVDAEDITTNSLDDSGSAGITLKTKLVLDADSAYDVGTDSVRLKNHYSDLIVTGALETDSLKVDAGTEISLQSDLLPSVDDSVSIGNSSYGTKNIYVKSGLNVYSSTSQSYLAVNPRPSIIIGHKLGMSFYNALNFNNGVEGKIRYMNSNDVDSTAYFLSSCQIYLPPAYKQVTISYLYKKNTNHGKFDVNYYALKEGEANDNPTLLNAHTIDSYNPSILYNVAGLFTISDLDDDSIYHILLQFIGTGKHASSSAYYKLINEDIVLEITE